MAWSWELLLQAFRGLGGTAVNFARKPGSRRGLVPIDPSMNAVLHVPEKLIVAVQDLEFVNGRLKVTSSATIGNAERSFLDNYLDGISWGGGGRDEALAFMQSLRELPDDVRQLLITEFGIEPLLEGGEEIAQQWYLENRRVRWRDKAVFAPLVELIDHAASAMPFADREGIALGGKFEGEIRIRRSDADPFLFFRRNGYASPEPVAFSQPLSMDVRGSTIEIAKIVNLSSKLGSVAVPDYVREGNALNVSCLLIGGSGFPRLPRGVFKAMTKDMQLPSADQTFDVILHNNRILFLKLLAVLEPYEGTMITTLRKVARYQLEAMSWCIGTREL